MVASSDAHEVPETYDDMGTSRNNPICIDESSLESVDNFLTDFALNEANNTMERSRSISQAETPPTYSEEEQLESLAELLRPRSLEYPASTCAEKQNIKLKENIVPDTAISSVSTIQEIIPPSFDRQGLQESSKGVDTSIPGHSCQCRAVACISSHPEAEWEVTKITAERVRRGKREYRVHWKACWVPAGQLSCSVLLREFRATHRAGKRKVGPRQTPEVA